MKTSNGETTTSTVVDETTTTKLLGHACALTFILFPVFLLVVVMITYKAPCFGSSLDREITASLPLSCILCVVSAINTFPNISFMYIHRKIDLKRLSVHTDLLLLRVRGFYSVGCLWHSTVKIRFVCTQNCKASQ